MSASKTNVQSLAQGAAMFFETRKREGDGDYVTLKTERPEWLYELVREAHGDNLPDDFVYATVSDAIDWLAESDGDPSDQEHEFADQVAIHTSDLIAWLASHINRMSYCDEAVEAALIPPDASMFDRLMAGQYMERREIFASVLSSLQEVADES